MTLTPIAPAMLATSRLHALLDTAQPHIEAAGVADVVDGEGPERSAPEPEQDCPAEQAGDAGATEEGTDAAACRCLSLKCRCGMHFRAGTSPARPARAPGSRTRAT